MPLKRITLRDFVIVRELDLELAGGFTVLTGETGAGKSILIDALQLALGARADATFVREGAPRTDVSAGFDCPKKCIPWLEEAGFDVLDELLLRRTVDASGKSRAFLNGSPATAAQLRALGEQLVDIHGQHAWQSLTRPESVRELLDAYAGTSSRVLLPPWQRWREAGKALAEARGAQDSLQRERERLAWQIGEVDKLAPASGEWETLSADHTRLAHAQSLLDAARDACAALEEDDGALPRLAHAQTLLENQQHLEPEFSGLTGQITAALAQLEDVAHSLHRYFARTDLDPERLAELDERISQWVSLARRYKRPPEQLPALLTGWQRELANLERAADLAALEAEETRAKEAWLDSAEALSAARKAAAPRLARAVTEAMQGLGMQGGKFEVALEKTAQPAQYGLEDVSFLVAGHAGTTPRPIGKVASGGELSRIALAVAVTTSELGGAGTLIFDEVDAGVGGSVAETVGRLMRQLGKDRQVLAVTHLPQVASCADQHLVVAKQREGKATVSTVSAAAGEQRIAEIARMLGGERMSGATLAHAREMLSISG